MPLKTSLLFHFRRVFQLASKLFTAFLFILFLTFIKFINFITVYSSGVGMDNCWFYIAGMPFLFLTWIWYTEIKIVFHAFAYGELSMVPYWGSFCDVFVTSPIMENLFWQDVDLSDNVRQFVVYTCGGLSRHHCASSCIIMHQRTSMYIMLISVVSA